MTKRFQLLLLFCITLLMHSAFSQNWGELKLTAGDGAFGDNFGWSVAISGNRLIVGAPQDDSNGSSSGSAYIFVNTGSGWVEEAKLIPSDGASSNWFGSSVDIDSNYAVVGAPYNPGQPGRGRAYIFKYQGGAWVEQAQLVPEDTSIGTFFGISVSISGEYALIGAYWENGVSSSSGAAYIFHRSDTIWTRQARLLASDGESFDHFGNAVALDGDYAIIGAKDDNDNGNNSGSAYVFHREGHAWMEQAKLLASDGNSQDNFGVSVAIKGSLAIVGANMLFNYLTGAAYIFRRDSTHWNEIAKLTASDVASRDEFGISVDISEGFALVG
ncbi:MAG: FG-GAP repeat protein, partial [Calditrichia bacterium]